jgi:hypothetical protein
MPGDRYTNKPVYFRSPIRTSHRSPHLSTPTLARFASELGVWDFFSVTGAPPHKTRQNETKHDFRKDQPLRHNHLQRSGLRLSHFQISSSLSPTGQKSQHPFPGPRPTAHGPWRFCGAWILGFGAFSTLAQGMALANFRSRIFLNMNNALSLERTCHEQTRQ